MYSDWKPVLLSIKIRIYRKRKLMSIRFWLGGERSDKSLKLYEYILEEAKKNPNRDYLVIVPEQFTLSTQRKFVEISSNHGIMNVDVSSFLRLAHRIGEEVGSYDSTVTLLNDMGKNLILQLLAQDHKEELSVYGDNIHKIGVITKLKSIISEFMQYGIYPETVDKMAEDAKTGGKSMLAGKLADVNTLYKAFQEYIHEKYTTTEELLDRIASIVYQSDTIKNSVIVFDGFTGFTPVQQKFLGTLLEYAVDIHVALLMEPGEEKKGQEHDLFCLSNRTIDQLERMADERRVEIKEPYRAWEHSKKDDSVATRLFVGQNPEDEIRMARTLIQNLVRDENYRYKDIAILCGDIEEYRHSIERDFYKAGVPFFIDKTQPMLLNPFTEFIRSLIAIYADNYSYEAMFRFLKSGFVDVAAEDIDLLDNYCLACGIKGSSRWHSKFTKVPRRMSAEEVAKLEDVRCKIVQGLDDFSNDVSGKIINAATKASVRTFTIALYNRIVASGIEGKLSQMAEMYTKEGEAARASEYSQIYVKIMDVLDELVELIPDEKVDVREYADLIDAGLDSIKVGMAPKSMDYVQVGDLTRSRLTDVKAVFIIGANEGVIPKVAPSGGVLNEAEREYLLRHDEELRLAPNAREDAYTQRLYIYMAMNKPKEKLFMSYAKVSIDGKSQLPSYIIRKVKSDNPGIVVKLPSDAVIDRVNCIEDAFEELGLLLGKVNSNTISKEDYEVLRSLVRYLVNKEEYRERTKSVLKTTLIKSIENPQNAISKAVAAAIYGKTIYENVTKLETYANCAYEYYMKYGLGLSDKELFSFEAKDLGSVYHDSLSIYNELITKEGHSWTDVSQETMYDYIDQAVELASKKSEDILESSARTAYTLNRIKRVMRRTVSVVTNQIKKGEFVPKYFEVDFGQLNDCDCLNYRLSDDEMLKLTGRIDRVDTCEKEKGIFVKIIDYKSSKKSLDFVAIYEGRQLQLLVYLNAAMEHEHKNTGKDVIPAGVLYYHIDDPIIGIDKEQGDDEILDKIVKELKFSGFVNSNENGEAAELMEKREGPAFVSLPIKYKTTGELGASNALISGEEFETLADYTKVKITQIGRNILDGNIAVPVPDGVNRITEPDCTYCDYKSICQLQTNNKAGYDTDSEGDDSSEEYESSIELGKSKKENKELFISYMKEDIKRDSTK